MFGFGTKKIRIVTHSGGFHADDVFGVATLLHYFKKDIRAVEIIRTRDDAIISAGEYVLDVGNEYDPTRNRFDHHQESFTETRVNGVPYASFGLLWKEFGESICGNKAVAEVIDQTLVTSIDAGDNGFTLMTPKLDTARVYSVSQVIGAFNPVGTASDKEYLSAFKNAVQFATEHLARVIEEASYEEQLRDDILASYEGASRKDLLVLDDAKGWPRGYISMVLNTFPDTVFFVRQHLDGTWQTVAVQEPEYRSRVALPEPWRGLRDEALQQVSGISDGVFCHKTGFMMVTKTKEGAIKAAEKALAYAQREA